jgi:ribosomal protein S12 methylthiotransferase
MGNGYWLQTLGCPKNQVDSEKLAGTLSADGLEPVDYLADADLVVVNTCAFIESARQESIDTILTVAQERKPGARLVVTGCLAERYGNELGELLPEVDLVAGFGTPVHVAPLANEMGVNRVKVALGAKANGPSTASTTTTPAGGFDLLELPRPPASVPWAYVKVAEGCDRTCGFCAIPSFRGAQRSRGAPQILDEVHALLDARPNHPGVQEIVLVAQDLASFGRDRNGGRTGPTQPIVDLVHEISALVERVRLLYLYPTGLTAPLIEAVVATGVPYFDLSLQHVSKPLVTRMRRWGDAERFLERIDRIRDVTPDATFRSSFLLGYPGETEEDHDELLAFLEAAQLDWAGFFTFSAEAGTYAVELGDQVPTALALERLRECAELQDGITARRRDLLVGTTERVLVDAPGQARTVHEAPEIDGIVRVPTTLAVGSLVDVLLTESLGTDLVGILPSATTPEATLARSGSTG